MGRNIKSYDGRKWIALPYLKELIETQFITKDEKTDVEIVINREFKHLLRYLEISAGCKYRSAPQYEIFLRGFPPQIKIAVLETELLGSINSFVKHER